MRGGEFDGGAILSAGKVPTDDPETQFVIRLEVSFFEGFHKDSLGELRGELTRRFGSRNEKLSQDDRAEVEYRGGAQILGSIRRDVWDLDLDSKLLEPFKRHHKDILERAPPAFESATVQLHTAKYLPFGILYLSLRLRSDDGQRRRGDWAGSYRHIFDEFVKELPGRLSPNNEMPRMQQRWLGGAKITQALMDKLQNLASALQESTTAANEVAEQFRAEVWAIIPILGKPEGDLLVVKPFGNVMTIFNEGGGFLGEAADKFSLFLYSTGNLMSTEDSNSYLLPLWLPYSEYSSAWHDFNFMPFLTASLQFARYTLVEGGKANDAVAREVADVRKLVANDEGDRFSQWSTHRTNLVLLQTETAKLDIELEGSAARSQSPIQEPPPKTKDPKARTVLIPQSSEWTRVFAEGPPGSWISEQLAQKTAREEEARRLLSGLRDRIKSVLEIAVTDYTWTSTDKMRRAAAVSVGLALIAIVVAAIAIFVDWTAFEALRTPP